MRNPFKLLRDLLPEPPLQVGTAISSADGVVTVELPGGGRVRARGSATAGQRLFVRNGLVEGLAPNLPVEIIEV